MVINIYVQTIDMDTVCRIHIYGADLYLGLGVGDSVWVCELDCVSVAVCEFRSMSYHLNLCYCECECF